MMIEGGGRVLLGLCAAVLVGAALQAAQAIFAPVAFALFVIALVWPLQRAAQDRIPAGIALIGTVLVSLAVLAGLAYGIVWAFGRVAQWVLANAGQLQSLYAAKIAWLESQGIAAAGVMSDQFDVRWLVRLAQGVLAQLQGIVSFVVVTVVFVILGLLEVRPAAAQLAGLEAYPAARRVLAGLAASAAKLRAYMLVRSFASVLTGVFVYAFARFMGLDLAAEWGVIAFVLNYIPFIGPLVATVFPTLVGLLQFGSWQAVATIFAALQVIQFLIGSYLEPRLAGRQLTVSPFMVLAAVFFGAFLWGVPGAFIGVPVLIAALTICEQFPGGAWVARLLSGRHPDPG
ncbi:AI-2E family transporter [Roseomonas sp. PWR1]|uniref:AI-2E family transporter n=1 Tax=Roseomonas nitratireducens TaxID=2820810 RepID=A0ABS4AXF5_9PROT|nr:AI-2E family transporter [Neoroseomonas nitratireducens]MBP0466052.1 AI-2E family transporter [Neoroseomonas nitratireducens]